MHILLLKLNKLRNWTLSQTIYLIEYILHVIEETHLIIAIGQNNLTNVTGPAKIGHVGSQNLTTFQNFGFHNFLFQNGMATKISEPADNLFGFTTLLTESKY